MAGCSRTIGWDERLDLNTGETLTVHRERKLAFQSAQGNPLDYGYSPEFESTLSFSFRGRLYTLRTDAAPLLIAVSHSGPPVVVADPRNGDWSWKNNFRCTVPFYVQFVPGAAAMTWSAKSVEPWLHHAETNLLLGIPEDASIGQVFDDAARRVRNHAVVLHAPELKAIDPAFAAAHCPQ